MTLFDSQQEEENTMKKTLLGAVLFSGAVIASPATVTANPSQCLVNLMNDLAACAPTDGTCAGNAGGAYILCMEAAFEQAPCDGPTCRQED